MYSAIAHSIASMPRGLSGFRSIHSTHAPTTPANTTQNRSMGSTCGVAGRRNIAKIRMMVAKGGLRSTSTPTARATAPSTSSWPNFAPGKRTAARTTTIAARPAATANHAPNSLPPVFGSVFLVNTKNGVDPGWAVADNHPPNWPPRVCRRVLWGNTIIGLEPGGSLLGHFLRITNFLRVTNSAGSRV
jgi:hypothetical protein